MKRFTVVLPVLNGGAYVKLCVRSVLSQSINDFDLVVLDNCSTDGTYEWLTSLNDARIRIYRSDRQLSIEDSWRRILTVPRNEYMTLIGHDDILYPDFLSDISRMMEMFPSAGLYHTHFHFIDAEGKVIRRCNSMPSFLTGETLLKGLLTRTVDSMGTGYVMRSVDYDRVGGIPVAYPKLLFADFELWLRLAENGGMAVHEHTSFAFRVHNSTTGSSADILLHQALQQHVDFLEQFCDRKPGFKEIIDQFASQFLLFYCSSLSHRLLRRPLNSREDVTVRSFIKQVNKMADKLGVDRFKPLRKISILAALIIDSNKVFRRIFKLIRIRYGKPFA